MTPFRGRAYPRFTPLILASGLACAAGDQARAVGRVLSVTTVTDGAGVELFRPVAASIRPGPDLVVLDKSNAELLLLPADRGVDTLARKGSGPGELSRPSAVGWSPADSAVVVVDHGNGRIQRMSLTGTVRSIVPYHRGARDLALSPDGQFLFASTYAVTFSWSSGRLAVPGDSLVTVVSLGDGTTDRLLGSPRPYPGQLVTIMGNDVRLAYDARADGVWLAWPFEPVVAFYPSDAETGVARTWEFRLPFTPGEPKDVRTRQPPFLDYDAQTVVHDLAVEDGYVMLLVSVAAAPREASSTDMAQVPQAIYVLNPGGELVCVVPLPITGTSMAFERPGAMIVVDGGSGVIFRVRYECP